MSYTVSLESYINTYGELSALHKAAFDEVVDKLASDGVKLSPFAPNLDEYKLLEQNGNLLLYVYREMDSGSPIGFCAVHICNDLRNGDLMATEDAIYILPAHRGKLGVKFVKCIFNDLTNRGVRYCLINSLNSFAGHNIWRRLGFRDYAMQLVCNFN